jgi:hypothetical protein
MGPEGFACIGTAIRTQFCLALALQASLWCDATQALDFYLFHPHLHAVCLF